MKKQHIYAAISLLLFFAIQIVLITLLDIAPIAKLLTISLLLAATALVGLVLVSLFKQYRALSAAFRRDHQVLIELQTSSEETIRNTKRLRRLETAKEDIVRKQTALFDLALDPERTATRLPSTDQRNNI